jgi:phage baseplate assembly protein gpV
LRNPADPLAGPARGQDPPLVAPSLGEEAVLLCPDGQIGNGVALLGLNNDTAPPPGDTLAELTEYEDGARIGYDPVTHALTALLPDGASALIEAPGGLTIRGDVTIEGTLTARDDVIGGGKSLKGTPMAACNPAHPTPPRRIEQLTTRIRLSGTCA